MARRRKASSKTSFSLRSLRTVGRIVVALIAAVLLAGAWVWHRTLPLTRVAVVGAHHARAAEVKQLVNVTPDSVALYSLSPLLLADRARRHPWVQEAHVRRLPTGTLRIRLEERKPAVLVMRSGKPSHYLDAAGFAMPLDNGADSMAAFADVPLLYGAPAYHPTQRIGDRALRDLIAALAHADPITDALISEVTWRPKHTVLTTSPTGTRGAVEVRLGPHDPSEQLRRLRAFWEQALLTRPETRFEHIDLRFAGQVITRESGPGAQPAAGPGAAPVLPVANTTPTDSSASDPFDPFDP